MSADRPSHQCNDGVVTCALRGFLLVPDVLYSFDPPLHRSRSRAPPSGRVHCPFVFSRLSVVSLSSLLAFPLLRVLSLRLLSPVLTFHELQAAFLSHHTGPPTAPLLPRAAAVSLRSLLPHLLSVYLPRFERGFTVGLQPSRVTGLQATSPERSPPSAPPPPFV